MAGWIKDFKCELVSWEELYDYGRVLAGKIRQDKFRPDVVIAIARGGFVPARTLVDFLMVDELLSLQVDHWHLTRRGLEESKPAIRHSIVNDLSGKKVLVVDDLNDSGESLKLAVDFVKKLRPLEVKSACVFVFKKTRFPPDYYAAKKEKTWFLFPWNLVEDASQLVTASFDGAVGEKKSLSMIQEELEASHGIRLPKAKLFEVIKCLEHKRVLMPCYSRNGRLVRWVAIPGKRR